MEKIRCTKCGMENTLVGFAWYRRLERDSPKTKHVRRSDVFSFWRVWITAWRNPSTVRPSALSNPGFPSGSTCLTAALWGSSLNARSLYEEHASRKAGSVPYRQTSCANGNRSYLKSQPYGRNSQRPNHQYWLASTQGSEPRKSKHSQWVTYLMKTVLFAHSSS